jgi:YL1 nuclear protein C-terminal domain
MEESLPVANFKCGTLTQSPGQKKRMWKSLKQIIAHEKTLKWREDDVTCKYIILHQLRQIIDGTTFLDSTINAPPSFRPAKKYSDISGLVAPYTDPQTKLNYHSVEEYQTVRSLPMDLTAGYLQIRGASNIVG